MKSLRNAIWYGVSTFGSKGIGFLLLPIYAAYLVPAVYGRWNLIELGATLASTFLLMGVPAATVRLLILNENDKFEETLTALAMYTLVIALLSPVLVYVVADALALPNAYLYAASTFVFGAIGFNQVGQARLQSGEKAPQHAAMALLQVGLLTGIGLAAMVWAEEGARLHALILGKAAGAIVLILAVIAVIRKDLRFGFTSQLPAILAFSAPLVLHQFSAFVLSAGDRFILEYFRSEAEVGVYVVGYTLASVVAVTTSTILLLVSPRYYRSESDQETSRPLYGTSYAITFVGCLTILAFPTVITWVFPPSYHASLDVLPILITGLIAHGVFAVLGVVGLSLQATKSIAMSTVLAAGLNIGLNFLMIPSYGMAGAALATLIAFTAEGIIVFVVFRARVPDVLGWGLFMPLALVSCLVAVGFFTELDYWPLMFVMIWVSVKGARIIGFRSSI